MLLVTGVVSCAVGFGQGLGEWLDQKRTEIKYMKAQIAALEAYAKLMEKGNGIAGDGLSWITELRQGDLDLHAAHFASLDAVKPVVRDDPRVRAAFDLSMRIKKIGAEIGVLLQQLGSPYAFVGDNLAYLCNLSEDNLAEVTENGALRLSDDERLGVIDRVYTGLKDLYLAAQQTLRDIRGASKNGL